MRTEMLKRERDTNELMAQEFMQQSAQRRLLLRVRLEEFTLQLAEIREARDIFEQSIVRDGVDHLTGRVPAEKFVRYMEEWLRSADSIIEKLRLRTSTQRYRHVALKHQLLQKEELGETLHAVDFDQMRIDNKILMERIESKNADLLQLKQKSGGVNLLLAKRRHALQKQLAEIRNISDQIEEFKRTNTAIETERVSVESELKRTEEKLGRTRHLISEYTVPELLDYVRIKKELDALRQAVKVWARRNHLQKIGLDTCVNTMRRLTGSPVERASWYEIKTHIDDDEISIIPPRKS